MKKKYGGVKFVERLQKEQKDARKKKSRAKIAVEKAAKNALRTAKKEARTAAKKAFKRDQTTVECAVEAAKKRFAKKNIVFSGDNFYRVVNESGELSKLPWHIYVPFEGEEPSPLTEKWLYKKRWILKRNPKGYYIVPDYSQRWRKRLKFFFKMLNDFLWGDTSDFIEKYIKKSEFQD